jgi:hypothetical protein
MVGRSVGEVPLEVPLLLRLAGLLALGQRLLDRRFRPGRPDGPSALLL